MSDICTCGHAKAEHKSDGCTALVSSAAGHHGGPELQYCVCPKFLDRESGPAEEKKPK